MSIYDQLLTSIKMIVRKSIFLIVTLIIYGVRSWYVCDELNFCNKIRNQDGKERFQIVKKSITLEGSTIKGELLNKDDQTKLTFTLTSLEDDTFRLIVNDPKRTRHTINEALDGEPKHAPSTHVSYEEDGFKVTVGSNVVNVTYDPFKIDVYRDGKLVIGLNRNSKMVFNKDSEAIAMDVWMLGKRAYGIPEHAERLSLKNTGPGGLDPYRLFNVDYYGYKVDSRESLYGAVPVLYGHGRNGTRGVFWLNSAQTFIDINTDNNVTALFISESGAIDLFFFTGPTLDRSVKQYTKLTGTAPLPQYFAIGFHQSRYNYDNQTDLLNVVSGFDKYNFPLDVMWLDIDYTDNLKYFTWNPENFSNPLGMQKTLNATGRKLVVIIDPHIKVERGYFVYDQALKNGYFAMNSDGSVYEGKCWPGASSYIDFTNPAARDWFATLYSFKNFANTTSNTYIWNDMNEPAVFESNENTMPMESVVFHGGWLHRDIHNTYGFFQTMGSYAGLMARSNNTLRPFILTRSHFAGSQRYATMWTGDNVADWSYLRISVPMCLTEALAGISFCGADVGGFLNNVEDELFQRWYQVGAWLPFYRSHATKGTERREPYLYPVEIQKRLRKALQERYAHLPYWYTLWWEQSTTGIPVIRPLTYHYDEEAVLDIDNEWLVGSDILVSPVMEKGVQSIDIYFPGKGRWYSLEGDTVTIYRGGSHVLYPVDLDTVPVFYRGGSIISRKDKIRQSTTHTHSDNFTVYIFVDDNNEASGNLYVDDYESFDYKNNSYLYVNFTLQNNVLELKRIDNDANYEPKGKVDAIYVCGMRSIKDNVSLNVEGRTINVPINRDINKDGCVIVNRKLDLTQRFTMKF